VANSTGIHSMGGVKQICTRFLFFSDGFNNTESNTCTLAPMGQQKRTNGEETGSHSDQGMSSRSVGVEVIIIFVQGLQSQLDLYRNSLPTTRSQLRLPELQYIAVP